MVGSVVYLSIPKTDQVSGAFVFGSIPEVDFGEKPGQRKKVGRVFAVIKVIKGRVGLFKFQPLLLRVVGIAHRSHADAAVVGIFWVFILEIFDQKPPVSGV